MSNNITTDLCIIGAGAGGLSVAAVASQLGIKVVLIEANKMGGDCLNYGCVPSKALIAAAKKASYYKKTKIFGITYTKPEIDFIQVMEYVQAVISKIAVHDSVQRFESLGVKVILATGKFIDPKTVVAGDFTIKAKRYVIATGSKPFIPPISGLNKIKYLTNETIFLLKNKPEHLIIIGAGPIGCELAQAFLNLDIKVSLIDLCNILPREEPDLISILKKILIKDGLDLYEYAEDIKINNKINNQDTNININFKYLGKEKNISGSHLLLATGRKPNVNKLNLNAGKIKYTSKGILVDQNLRSSNKKVYCLGDVITGYQFTHVAEYEAGIIIKNILFCARTKADYLAIPWVTYTNPEVAHVGLTIKQAESSKKKFKILSKNFTENDRAITEHATVGKILILVDKHGYVLGVSIIAENAGELLYPWLIAIKERKKIKNIAEVVIPYPTISEINKRVAGSFYLPLLFSKITKMLVKILKIFW